MEKISINTPFIKLDSLMKLTGRVSGGQAKQLIQDSEVIVCGAVCTQRGRKLKAGDTVEFGGERFEVVSNADTNL